MASQACVLCGKSSEELYMVQISHKAEQDKLGWCSRECREKYLAKEEALKKAREREKAGSMSEFQTGYFTVPGNKK